MKGFTVLCTLLFVSICSAIEIAIDETDSQRKTSEEYDSRSSGDLESSATSAKLFNLGSLFGNYPISSYGSGSGYYPAKPQGYYPNYPNSYGSGSFYPTTGTVSTGCYGCYPSQSSGWYGSSNYPNYGTAGYPTTNYYPTSQYYPQNTGTNVLGIGQGQDFYGYRDRKGYGGYGGYRVNGY